MNQILHRVYHILYEMLSVNIINFVILYEYLPELNYTHCIILVFFIQNFNGPSYPRRITILPLLTLQLLNLLLLRILIGNICFLSALWYLLIKLLYLRIPLLYLLNQVLSFLSQILKLYHKFFLLILILLKFYVLQWICSSCWTQITWYRLYL